jgi:hypothetical protein
MWDKDDCLARWIHAACAVPLVAYIVFVVYLLSQGYPFMRDGRSMAWETSSGCGAVYLAYRLLWYAATGRDCINRDDYD